MQQNDIDNGSEGVSGNVQSSLQSLLASALGAALEPVSRLETDYKVILEEREGYRERLHTLQQQLAAAESSSREQSKENRILKHQKTKLEEQHDRILKQQKGLEDVDSKLTVAQEMIKVERQEAGERHDQQERTLSQKAIEAEELAQQAKQQAQKSAMLFNKRKELSAKLKEKEQQLKEQAEAAVHQQEELTSLEKKVAEQEQSLSNAKDRENRTLELMKQRVAEVENRLKEQSEGRAKEQNAHKQQLKSLSAQHEEEVDTIEEGHALKVGTLNNQLRTETMRAEAQAEEAKRLTDEARKLQLSREKAERELGRVQQDHTVLESEAHVMTEQNSSWEVQLKEMKIREKQQLAELSAIQEDNEKNDEEIVELKARLVEATADMDAQAAQHKQLISVMQRSYDENMSAKTHEHTKDMHEKQEQAEQDRAANVARKAEVETKREELMAQVQVLQRERDGLAADLQEATGRGTQESARTGQRMRELEMKLENEAAERARERMELGKQVQTYKTANRVIKAEQVEQTRSINQQLDQARLELHERTEELAAARATIMQITEERAQFKQESEVKATALAKLKTEHVQATQQLAEVREENAEYERMTTKQRIVVEAKTAEVLELDRDLDELRAQKEGMKKALVEAHTTHDATLAARSEDARQKAQQHEEELEAVTARLQAAVRAAEEKYVSVTAKHALQLEQKVQGSLEHERTAVKERRGQEELTGKLAALETKAKRVEERLQAQVAELAEEMRKEQKERALDQAAFNRQFQEQKVTHAAAVAEEQELVNVARAELEARLQDTEKQLGALTEEQERVKEEKEKAAKLKERAERTLHNVRAEHSEQFDQLAKQTEDASHLENHLTEQTNKAKLLEVRAEKLEGDLSRERAKLEKGLAEVAELKKRHIQALAEKAEELKAARVLLEEEEEAKHEQGERAEAAEHALERRSVAFDKELEAKQQKLRELYEVMEATQAPHYVRGDSVEESGRGVSRGCSRGTRRGEIRGSAGRGGVGGWVGGGDGPETEGSELQLPIIPAGLASSRPTTPAGGMDQPRPPSRAKPKGHAKMMAGRSLKDGGLDA
jgi:hypothetical protein